MAERGADGDHLGVRFGMHEARVSVAGIAFQAMTSRTVRFIQHDGRWGMERMMARLDEVVIQPLDPRLVRDRGVGIRLASERLRGILTAQPMDVV